MKIELLAIDEQNDFHDIPENIATGLGFKDGKTALPVAGAWEDAKRLADFINRCGKTIDGITMTVDTHQQYDVGHKLFWMDSKGNSPSEFTPISGADIRNGIWTPRDRTMVGEMIDYAERLEAEKLYNIFIWPDHCIVGTPGYDIVKPVMDAVLKWEKDYIDRANFVTKGHNPYTEHYGGFQAQVPIASDPTTQLNMPLISRLAEADIVFITGQALSHCVASTARQMADNFGDDNIKKMVLLKDTSSSVTGFEKQGDDFVAEMIQRGMRAVNTTDVKLTRDGISIGGA